MDEIEALGKIVVDCGFHLHRELGPGLLASVYEILMFEALKGRGLVVERQIMVPIKFRGIIIDNAFRADPSGRKVAFDRTQIDRTPFAGACKTTPHLFASNGSAPWFPDKFWDSLV